MSDAAKQALVKSVLARDESKSTYSNQQSTRFCTDATEISFVLPAAQPAANAAMALDGKSSNTVSGNTRSSGRSDHHHHFGRRLEGATSYSTYQEYAKAVAANGTYRSADGTRAGVSTTTTTSSREQEQQVKAQQAQAQQAQAQQAQAQLAQAQAQAGGPAVVSSVGFYLFGPAELVEVHILGADGKELLYARLALRRDLHQVRDGPMHILSN
jgi:hypothetical protein